ncbi:3-dehydrosphinganine reductase [Lodderomyces elongisporus]|uniref:3-dehydrosphinganine reductase n=1 Tax=Lodderomyces elongisporus TaxID=36914 RepID=UPI00291D4882|nr:3-dehydrosphinganine reductase [Lodderomyces elongisporus]WLF78761.1 3-dehydrosphinganine reductase [Lodderomyces elongisporus]
MWYSRNNFSTDGKTALIIGASQGLGVEIAKKLYLENCSVILVARTTKKLEAQSETIRKLPKQATHTAKVTFFTCDVSEYDACRFLWKEMASQGFNPDIIMCCAGSSVPKLFGDLTAQDISSGIDINYKTAINVVHTGFKHFCVENDQIKPSEWPRRHIVLFGSVVGFFPFIGYAQYAPMKAAIDSLSIILRQELGPYNFRVSSVYPGNFQSEGFEEEQKTKPEITKKIEGPSYPIPGDKCAGIIIDCLKKGYDSVTTDTIGWLLGCGSLGVRPRQWGFFQVIIGFIFSIIEPIAMWVIGRDIQSSFNN